MTQLLENLKCQEDIDKITQSNMDPVTKKSLIASTMQASFATQKKSSTIQTILGISNSMVGTSTLALAVLYTNSGLLTSVIVAAVVAIMSTKTCHLLVEHNKYEEADLPQTIARILGIKWQRIYMGSNILLLYLSGLIYMILVCDQIYSLLIPVLEHYDVSCAKPTQIIFTEISSQWVGIAYFLIIFPLMCLRSLGIILKLVPLGVVSVVTFFFFIIYKGINNWIKLGSEIFNRIKWVSGDLASIAGVFTLGFMIHSLIVPIIKRNAIQANNKRDISIAYGWTWFVYQVVGVFGAMAIVEVSKIEGTDGSTVLNFFNDDWPVVLVQVLLTFQLTFVFPVLQSITRSQFLGLIYGVEKVPNLSFYGFTLFYALSCLIAQMFKVNLTTILSLTGAIIGLFQIYIIPSLLHVRCLYNRRTKTEDARAIQNIQRISGLQSTGMDTSGLMDNVDLSQLEPDTSEIACNDHREIVQTLSETSRYLIYGAMCLFGTVVAVANLFLEVKKAL